MKSLSLVAIILALAACQGAEVAEKLGAQSRSIASIIVDTLELVKVQMVQGWPQYGIPPLAPLQLKHKEFDLNAGELHAKGAFDDLTVHGLNEFEIKIIDLNLLLSRLKFEFHFASLNVSTQYQADVGANYRMTRNGGAFMALEDLNISGHIKYSTGIVGSNNYLRIKEIIVNVVTGNVVSNIENLSKYRILNQKINEIIEEFISLTVNDNTEFFADWLDSTVTPICNDMIGDRTIKDIIGIITGS
ncbi:uncharacterized protein LOC6576481 [Drosophila mojavensis]|uniref:Uncharacterized protein n=1 Tax=Drosophila mojavensis TaxID=7230 RepID=B4KEN3_DROMO|nr:uncharacterized protein LOC6576481 [Drosophila mojavensis]EDW11912.1 uncharacterized protein Dmoj_GI17403 [Drosophila mojavensis]